MFTLFSIFIRWIFGLKVNFHLLYKHTISGVVQVASNFKMNENQVPNIVMWAWMRTVLKLCGSELLIFSYLFSQTFDSSHRCFACLSSMGDWFGITRQAVSRNIDKLVERGFVVKECRADCINPMIKHNNYIVNMPHITELCEKSDKSSYENFLDSYRSLLKQKFPEDGAKIDNCLDELLTWHQNKDVSVCVKLNEIASLIYARAENNESITDVLKVVQKENKKVAHNPEKTYIEKYIPQEVKNVDAETNQIKLFKEPKRKSKKAQQNEWDSDKRAMNTSFIYMKLGGNEELADLLDKFLDTANGRSYTPDQWQNQLDNLYKYGRTPKRMIEGVKYSFMNNYRALYLVDKSEVDIDEKLNEVERYVKANAEDDQELKELLYSYVTEVPKGKVFTLKQFQMQLKTLDSLCPTTEEKIESVSISYMRSYPALAYAKQETDTSDIQAEKISVIEKYVKDKAENNEELKGLLCSYIEEVPNGKNFTINQLKLQLKNLDKMCKTVADKIASVEMSYACSYASLAYPNARSSGNSPNTAVLGAVDVDKKIEKIKQFIADGYYYLVDGLEEALTTYVTETSAGQTMNYNNFCIILKNLRVYCLSDSEKVNKVNQAIQNNSTKFAVEDFEETRKLKSKNETRDSKAASLDRNRMQKCMMEKAKNPNHPKLGTVKAFNINL